MDRRAVLVSAAASLVASIIPAQAPMLIDACGQVTRGPYDLVLVMLQNWKPGGRPSGTMEQPMYIGHCWEHDLDSVRVRYAATKNPAPLYIVQRTVLKR